MARPRKSDADALTRRLIVRLSDDDRAAIRANARKAGLRVSEYVRRVAVAGHIVNVQQSVYGIAVAAQLRKIGINLNQLMPIAHVNGEIPHELNSVWRKLEALLDRIIRTM